MFPVALKIGGFELSSYGVLSALGYAAAAFYARSWLKNRLGEDNFWNAVAALIVGAMLGGKLLYAVLFWRDYGGGFFERAVNLARDFRYGFVYLGGLAGSAAAGFWYFRRHKIPFAATADYFAPAVALGHAIGRIGCFLAGCCYGRPSAGWIGVKFTDPRSLVAAPLLGVPLHPAQLYESAADFSIFLLLHYCLKRGGFRREGAVLLLYGALYAAARFAIEFFRGDERGASLAGLSPSQIGAVLLALSCACAYRFLPLKKS